MILSIILSFLCIGLGLSTHGCRKKAERSLTIWRTEVVDEENGILRKEVVFPPEYDGNEKKMTGSAVGSLIGEVQLAVENRPEAVIRIAILINSIETSPVTVLEDGSQRVIATLPIRGKGSLAEVLGVDDIRFKDRPTG